MPIKSNITDRRPRSEKFRREIQLISGGYACPAAFPGGKITILPWDSSIDQWLSDSSNEATGAARDRILYDLLAKLCILGPCKLEDFVLGDVNTVLLVARSIANLNKIEYLTKCPACGQEEIDSIVVPDELKPVGQKSANYNGFDTITLPESKDVVAVRPLRIRDTLDVIGRTPEAKAKISDSQAMQIAPIVSINDTTPERIDELMEWHGWLHPLDVTALEQFQEDNTPHLSQELTQQCGKCKAIYMHKLVIDQEFFRSGRMGTVGRALAANL